MTLSVKTRQVVGPEDAARRNTQGLREGFVIENLFRAGEINLTYSHLDRMIVGGVSPTREAPRNLPRSRDRDGCLSRTPRGGDRQYRWCR